MHKSYTSRIFRQELQNLVSMAKDLFNTNLVNEQLKEYDKIYSPNNHLAEDLKDKYRFQITIRDIISDSSNFIEKSLIPKKDRPVEEVGSIIGVIEFIQRQKPAIKNKIRDKINNVLSSKTDLVSLLHEVRTARILEISEWQVEIFEDAKKGGFDFIAKRENVELEVECKQFFCESGRRLSVEEEYTLINDIATIISNFDLPERRLYITLYIKQTIRNGSRFAILLREVSDSVRTLQNKETDLFYLDIREDKTLIKLDDDGIINRSMGIIKELEKQDCVENEAWAAFVIRMTSRHRPFQSLAFTLVDQSLRDRIKNLCQRQVKNAGKRQISKTRPLLLSLTPDAPKSFLRIMSEQNYYLLAQEIASYMEHSPQDHVAMIRIWGPGYIRFVRGVSYWEMRFLDGFPQNCRFKSAFAKRPIFDVTRE